MNEWIDRAEAKKKKKKTLISFENNGSGLIFY